MSRLLNKSQIIQGLILLIVITFLIFLGNYGLKVVRIRTRDAQRIADLNNLSGSLTQYYMLNKKCPESINEGSTPDRKAVSAYEKVSLGQFISRKPKDPKDSYPYKYRYAWENSSCVIWAKLEDKNYRAINDGGNHKDYYEIGQGGDWQKIIPPSLP